MTLDCFELVILKEIIDKRKSLKTEKLLFYARHLHLYKELPFVTVSPSLHWEVQDDHISRKAYQRRRWQLKSALTTIPSFTVFCLITSYNCLPLHPGHLPLAGTEDII